MTPYEERENDAPEWEIEDEKIPDSLQKKWKDEEKEGLRAGVCRSCGYTFTKEDLSCRHCGAPTEMPDGAIVSLKNFLFKSPLGILLLVLIIASIICFLVIR